jgi:hypothetical protein
MPGPSVPLFLNPTAGRGRAGQRLARIEQLFAESGLAITMVPSRTMGDIEAQVTEHIDAGAKQVIVAGGDGSIHEAVNGLLAASSRAALGVIPVGTGNDFAKAANITLAWEQAARELAARIATGGATRAIDVGRLNQRYFANSLGVKVVVRGNALRSNRDVVMTVSGSAPLIPFNRLQILLEASVTIGNLGQRVELFDFVAGNWVQVDQRPATTTDSYTAIDITNQPERFLSPATNTVSARVTFDSTNAASRLWYAKVDQLRAALRMD